MLSVRVIFVISQLESSVPRTVDPVEKSQSVSERSVYHAIVPNLRFTDPVYDSICTCHSLSTLSVYPVGSSVITALVDHELLAKVTNARSPEKLVVLPVAVFALVKSLSRATVRIDPLFTELDTLWSRAESSSLQIPNIFSL